MLKSKTGILLAWPPTDIIENSTVSVHVLYKIRRPVFSSSFPKAIHTPFPTFYEASLLVMLTGNCDLPFQNLL